MSWYSLISGDPLNPNNYRILPAVYTDQNPPGCMTGCIICAIFLSQTTLIPTSIPQSVQDMIAIALATGTPQRPSPFTPYQVLLRC